MVALVILRYLSSELLIKANEAFEVVKKYCCMSLKIISEFYYHSVILQLKTTGSKGNDFCPCKLCLRYNLLLSIGSCCFALTDFFLDGLYLFCSLDSSLNECLTFTN